MICPEVWVVVDLVTVPKTENFHRVGLVCRPGRSYSVLFSIRQAVVSYSEEHVVLLRGIPSEILQTYSRVPLQVPWILAHRTFSLSAAYCFQHEVPKL